MVALLCHRWLVAIIPAGNVTATLKALGMDNNTLIVFVADNGGPIFGGDSSEKACRCTTGCSNQRPA